jgi:hypothetical protein
MPQQVLHALPRAFALRWADENCYAASGEKKIAEKVRAQ